MNATNRNEALIVLQRYIDKENYIKDECRKNRVNYERYVMKQEQAFRDLIDEKFPEKSDYNEQEDDEIITDGQVPF